jgi:hypothetical protein
MYRAFRKGEVNVAQNLALTLFYLGDLCRIPPLATASGQGR